MAARRVAPGRPCNSGSKNAWPRGIVPCGISATSSPAFSERSASMSGRSDPLPRSTRMPPSARERPDDGRVEHFLLSEEPRWPAGA